MVWIIQNDCFVPMPVRFLESRPSCEPRQLVNLTTFMHSAQMVDFWLVLHTALFNIIDLVHQPRRRLWAEWKFQFFSLYLTMLLQTNLTANLIQNQNIVSSCSYTANIEQRTPQNCPWLFIVCLLVSVLNDLKLVDPQSDALRRGAYRNFNPIQPILSYVAFEHLSQYIQSI